MSTEENLSFLSTSIGVRGVAFGRNVRIIEPVNIYQCSLGDDVFVGPFCEIQSGVVVGKKTKIQSHSFICELVTIGEGCFIGHGVKFVNDKFHNGQPANGNKNLWLKTNIGKNVSIGSNATILPVSIIDGVVIGAGSVVTKDISVKGVYTGNPAKLIKTL